MNYAEETLARRQARFQTLVAGVYTRLYNLARRALRNPHDAEDVTQEAIARAWAHFESYDPSRSFEGWIFRIANNLVIDHCRRRMRRQEISLDAPGACEQRPEGGVYAELFDSTGDPQACLMAGEVSEGLQSAVRALPSNHRAILLLVEQEHSYEQIARALDCPIGTVRSRVHRARTMLRRNLEEKKILV